MSRKQHVVELSAEDRNTLDWFVSTGTRKAEDITRARILLKADEGLTDAQICEHLGCSIGTPYRTRKAFTERGLAAIHRRKPDREYDRKLDGDAEARLIKLACSDPPEGHARWTLHLLADELVTLDEIDFESVSHETVRQRLKKNTLKPHLYDYWAIPAEDEGQFAYHIEDVLDLYHEPYDQNRPVICFDETSKALRGHKRDPLPARPGAVARIDTHYERNGKQNLHLATEPLTGWVTVAITEKRKTADWIDRMVELADEHYPDANCIRVVLDNLNTHNPAAFYRYFPPDIAHAYLERFEFHYTPKHGSWLNMAEIEIGVLKRQCLNRRIYHAATLRSEVAAWQKQRNAADGLIDWQFTTDDARTKLRRLYPVPLTEN
ncbi:IS630 family transposase [Halobellus sp. Atlit-38R]|uniref:IS630 family transposase n=1 Tax=Halobellus sp. Atlit-38R TaxID=2282131 RepID=UPI001F2E141F|nr:IS630 family transposase [Halobellus sp. Atlit-38R]